MRARSFFLFLLVATGLFAQSGEKPSVYTYKLGLDIPIGVITLGTGGTSLILHKKNQPLTAEEIDALQVTDINRFDRSAVYRYSRGAEISSDVFQYTSMFAPAFLLFDRKIRQEAKYFMPIWAETFALTTALTMFTKELAQRTRPFVYNPDAPYELKLSKSAKASFFSGHTSTAAASTFFIAKVYADYHPDSRFKPLLWTGAAIIPAITGLCRYGAGKHFFTDILVGYAIGSTVGILVPHLHKRRS